MDTLIWIGIAIGVGAVVWLAAPYHQRIIDNRPVVAGERDEV
jgi:hypothetical protein